MEVGLSRYKPPFFYPLGISSHPTLQHLREQDPYPYEADDGGYRGDQGRARAPDRRTSLHVVLSEPRPRGVALRAHIVAALFGERGGQGVCDCYTKSVSLACTVQVECMGKQSNCDVCSNSCQ